MMLLGEERYTWKYLSFCDPHGLKGRCDSSHVNPKSWVFKRKHIPFLCPTVATFLFVGMGEFAPQILSAVIPYKANVNARALLEMQMLSVFLIHRYLPCIKWRWVWRLICLLQVWWTHKFSCVRTSGNITLQEGFIFDTLFLLFFSLWYTLYVTAVKNERG